MAKVSKKSVFATLDRIQATAVRSILRDLKKTNKALVVMATGLGKTETAIKAIAKLPGRHLWVVGRNSLVEQTYARFIDRGEHEVGMLNGAAKDIEHKIVVASVQTLSKPNILKLFAKDDFTTVWVDEAHHAPATTGRISMRTTNRLRSKNEEVPERPIRRR